MNFLLSYLIFQIFVNFQFCLRIVFLTFFVGLCKSAADDKKLNQIDNIHPRQVKSKKQTKDVEEIQHSFEDLKVLEQFPYGYGYGLGGYGIGGLFDPSEYE